MIIRLDDKYVMDVGNYGFVVIDLESKQVKAKKDGSTYTVYRNQWYTPSLPIAIKRYVHLVLKDTNEEVNLTTFISRYKSIVDRIYKDMPKEETVNDERDIYERE